MSTLPPSYIPLSTSQSVVVTDVDMSIASMCRFMVKWAIASIPAIIILWLIMFAVAIILGLLFHGIFHSFPLR